MATSAVVLRAALRGPLPRLAGAADRPGQLRIPALSEVRVRRSGVVLSGMHGRLEDPFRRDDQGLFLAERFARLDLGRPRHLRAWIAANGAPALASLAPYVPFEQSGRRADWTLRAVLWEDALSEVRTEQTQVRWFLTTFASVTEPQDRARWAVPSDPDAWVPPSARLTSVRRDFLDMHRSAALRRVAPRGLPWSRWIDVLAGLMRPHLLAALQSELSLEPKQEIVRLRDVPDPLLGRWEEPLDPAFLTSRWDSILCPIYLQLFEALRRLSEGQQAVRVCLECGEPFLALDARRRRFCSDTQRNRYNQRGFRERHSRD
ncbi:MAG: hypothetical protein ACLQBX_02170 [Candidatus Limnocylindrales bacterium]